MWFLLCMQGIGDGLIYPVAAIAVVFLPITLLVGAGYGVYLGSMVTNEAMKKAFESAKKNKKECIEKLRQHGIYKHVYDLTRKIDERPTAKLYFERGRIWFFEGDYRNALSDLTKALNNGYDTLNYDEKYMFEYALGVTLHNLGDYVKAQRRLDECEQLYKYNSSFSKGDVTPSYDVLIHSSALNTFNMAMKSKDNNYERESLLIKALGMMNYIIKEKGIYTQVHKFHRALIRYYLSFCPSYFEIMDNDGEDKDLLPGVKMTDEGLRIMMFAIYDMNAIRQTHYDYFTDPDRIQKLSEIMINQCGPFFYAFFKRGLDKKYNIKHRQVCSNLYGFPQMYGDQNFDTYLHDYRLSLVKNYKTMPSEAYFFPLPGDNLPYESARLLLIAILKPNVDCPMSMLSKDIIQLILSYGKCM
eukprot:TRINITY_DN1231_c0_g1_i2.p1 TRINITY_DN1231_c0_g1~~TRINITY_DN1231_c0_g1_i2.p1  ORF type:complete len:414 (-),score=51.06 TRINITY_DN1231_c0_g1_i2:51-1292(-)